MRCVENKILYLLSNSTGNILDDAVLIETLANSKVTSQEINRKVAEARETELEIDVTRETELKIDVTRESYRSFATRVTSPAS